MLVDLKTPNGCVVHVREEAVERLIAAGFKRIGTPPPKRRTTKAKE